MAIESRNPATGVVTRTFDEWDATAIDSALDRARDCFPDWKHTPIHERTRLLRAAGQVLERNRDRYAALMTEEMGKPIGQSEAEIDKCKWACDYYADNAAAFLQPISRPTDAVETNIAFNPLGPVLAIMPWNFPFWQVFRFAAPALAAGNVALLKHASNVPQCAEAIEEVFREAGFPDGAFQTMFVSSGGVEKIVEDWRVRAVTLTGSGAAGSKVAAAAGRTLKKSVLELGGSDPFVVLGDADVEAAADTAVKARHRNAGQACNAAKRFIVVDSVAERFQERFVEGVQALKVGDPTDRDTDVGPLAREDLLETLSEQVASSAKAGANVLCGGSRLPGSGYYFEPTVLSAVPGDAAAMREETFGPLSAIVTVPDAQSAITVANNTRYGLGASIWTSDVEYGKALACDVEAGSVFINGATSSDPRVPFGGVKDSGYGRELSEFGLREFVNIQTVSVVEGPTSDNVE